MVSRDGGFQLIWTSWSRFFEIFRGSSDDDASWRTLEYELFGETFEIPFLLFILRDTRLI